MKLAFSTLGCPGWSWNEIFATAKDMGLDGIEIRGIADEMYAPNIKVLTGGLQSETKSRLQKAKLELSMLTSGACLGLEDTTDYMTEARAYIDLAQELSVPFVRVMITPVPNPTKANITQAVMLYRELCAYGADKSVMPLIETNGPLADSKIMAKFITDTNHHNSGVLWDIHHPYRYFGEAPADTYNNLGGMIKYLHVKDSVLDGNKITYRMMGYGDVPVFDTLKLLHANNYDGYISLEWVKRWNPDLQEAGIVFSHYANYITTLINQL